MEFILKASSNRKTICFNFQFVLALNNRTASQNNKHKDCGDNVARGSKSKTFKRAFGQQKKKSSIFSLSMVYHN